MGSKYRPTPAGESPPKTEEDDKTPYFTSVIPPSYIKRQIREKMACSLRFAKAFHVYLAAVMDYLLVEVLELASSILTKNSTLFHNTTIPQGGVFPIG
ncbi:histone H2A [Tieghemostelium lacteum]|uniref:Histone H2A n=1 Tax=Tieghemostelium lacteum TaxID=361077 RepID=A0A152A1B8_TIELA|nr:histone H2A [Tieghemostelium lacteum]|eukprot:KYQ99874.1 histone H2A [Tieghemostelium lacteum]